MQPMFAILFATIGYLVLSLFTRKSIDLLVITNLDVAFQCL